MRHRPQPLLPLSAAAGFLFDIKDEDQLPANSQSQYSLTAPSSAAQFQSCPPNITYQSSADSSTVYTRSAAFSAAMFRLGSRSKSSQASAALYSTNQGGIGVSEIPYQPTSDAPASQDPLRVQGQFSPRGSSDSQSSTSLSVVTRRRQSTGVFHKRGLSPTTSAYTTTTAATYSMARSTRSGLLGRGRKHLNVAEEFDPTTFRKNRSRPAVAARGQDAVYQEYDDLFEEEEDEVNSYADGEVSQTDVSGDEKRSHLLQADGATSVRDNSPERLQVPPKTQRKAQRPDNLNLELLASALPSVGDVAIAASTAPPQTPPGSWPRSPHMTTPPRSTAPSVEETMDPRLPMTAPPTPPPKSASLLSLDTNVNDRPVTTVKHDQLSSRRTMPSVTRVNGRKFGERTSSMGAASMVSIGRSPSSEGLNFVNIPSPTLFVYPGWSARSDGSGNAHAPQPGAWALNANSVMQTPPAFAESSSNIYMMTMLLDEAEGSVSDLDETSVSPKSSSRSISLDETNAGTKLHLNIEDNNYEDTPEATEISADEFLHIKNRSESRNPSLASSTGFRPSLIEPGEESNHKKEAFEPTSEAGVSITPVPAEQKIGKRRRGSNREIKDSSSEREDMVEGGPKPDPAYLRAFRAFVKASANNDAFISRAPRFDAIQAHRICSNLRDDCPLQASCPPKARRLSNATRSPIDSRARQREASEEIMTSLWALMAGRWLNFGKMIVSPAHEQLIATCMKSRRRRGASKRDSGITQMFAEAGVLKHSVANEKRRVLDLGGAPVADWGWHCAVDYPKVKVYTVTERAIKLTNTSLGPPPRFQGPKNHRHLAVERLYRLPFPDNHFDVVSARTLFLTLKSSIPLESAQQTLDEYDRCLEECMRVLKPGGYFEYQLFDSDVINAGPLAADLFAHFSAKLEASGRDPEPTKLWITRLNDVGFTDIMRAWSFLPLAPPASKPKVPSKDYEDEPMSGHNSHSADAPEEQVRRKIHTWESSGVKGSTKDVAAVGGLLGGWVWEKWLRSAGIVDEETVGNIIEEARECGSGLRSLCGYARKPLL